jgi:hypothetical protein
MKYLKSFNESKTDTWLDDYTPEQLAKSIDQYFNQFDEYNDNLESLLKSYNDDDDEYDNPYEFILTSVKNILKDVHYIENFLDCMASVYEIVPDPNDEVTDMDDIEEHFLDYEFNITRLKDDGFNILLSNVKVDEVHKILKYIWYSVFQRLRKHKIKEVTAINFDRYATIKIILELKKMVE